MAKRGAARWRLRSCAQQASSVTASIRSASADRWSASTSTVSWPARSCASRRNTWAWCASRSTSICRSVSPSWRASCGAQAGAEFLPVRRRVERARVEQLVQQQRVARDVGRGPARCGQQLHHLFQRLRVFVEQRQIGAAPADGLEQVERARERGFGRASPWRRARSRAAAGRRSARGSPPAAADSAAMRARRRGARARRRCRRNPGRRAARAPLPRRVRRSIAARRGARLAPARRIRRRNGATPARGARRAGA